QPTEFTLADRSRMSYPVLLGRSFLKDVAVVDVGQEFIHPRSKKR
ncbi:MAG: RimK/LysX family protein, partial [Pseudomonadota bacterium]|nr:RimK/LysX family protein [Pseudomonadota bacterium]